MQATILLPPDKRFYVCDGTVLNSMEELLHALLVMDDATFAHHVNEHKHDFHRWVKDVFENHRLAWTIKGERTRAGLAKRVFGELYA